MTMDMKVDLYNKYKSSKGFEARIFLSMVALLTGMSLISGCVSQEPRVEYIIKTVEVKVPVVQPCVKPEDVPVKVEQPNIKKSDSDFKKVRYLMVEQNNNSIYQQKLEAIVNSCKE